MSRLEGDLFDTWRTPMKLVKTNKGLSLMELLVVMGISAALAVVAVPNFKSLLAKGKSREAFGLLTDAFNKENSFYFDYSQFASCLGSMGFTAPPSAYYTTGFASDDVNSVTGSSCTSGVHQIEPAIAKAPSGETPADGSDLSAGALASASTFTVGAVGNISGDVASHDQWHMNDSKILTHTSQGY